MNNLRTNKMDIHNVTNASTEGVLCINIPNGKMLDTSSCKLHVNMFTDCDTELHVYATSLIFTKLKLFINEFDMDELNVFIPDYYRENNLANITKLEYDIAHNTISKARTHIKKNKNITITRSLEDLPLFDNGYIPSMTLKIQYKTTEDLGSLFIDEPNTTINYIQLIYTCVTGSVRNTREQFIDKSIDIDGFYHEENYRYSQRVPNSISTTFRRAIRLARINSDTEVYHSGDIFINGKPSLFGLSIYPYIDIFNPYNHRYKHKTMSFVNNICVDKKIVTYSVNPVILTKSMIDYNKKTILSNRSIFNINNQKNTLMWYKALNNNLIDEATFIADNGVKSFYMRGISGVNIPHIYNIRIDYNKVFTSKHYIILYLEIEKNIHITDTVRLLNY